MTTKFPIITKMKKALKNQFPIQNYRFPIVYQLMIKALILMTQILPLIVKLT